MFIKFSHSSFFVAYFKDTFIFSNNFYSFPIFVKSLRFSHVYEKSERRAYLLPHQKNTQPPRTSHENKYVGITKMKIVREMCRKWQQICH